MIKKILQILNQTKINIINKIKNLDFTKKFKFFKTNPKIKKYKEKISKRGKKIRTKNIQLKLNISKINYKKLFINIIIYSIIIFLVILKTNLFKIQKIDIIPLDENTNTQLILKNLNFLKHKLIFKIEKENIKNKILQIEENIKDINISKKYPHNIKIELSSYKTLFETQIKNQKYYILKNGSLVKAKNIKTDYPFLKLKKIVIPNFPDYKKLLKPKNLEKINFITKKLKENILNIKIKNIIYYKTIKEVHFIINNNSRIIFDLVGDTKAKLKQLYVFNKEKINITKGNIIYLDNRINGKIYYCPKEDKLQCIKNLNFIYDEKLTKKDF